ncbi:MAG: hypothetical protein HY731_08890, partial [Candidatus Tectomicrobia bacterium]|nr:hypothetical protein [Candidatus Tectomicrobia bacterium]
WKVPFIPIYLAVAAGILYSYWPTLFYETAKQSFGDLPRLYGCLAFSYLGFAFLIACSIRTHKGDMGFPFTYLWYFPILCSLGAFAAFSLCQIFETTRGYLFNFIAYPLAFLFGFLVEVLIPALLSRFKDLIP